MCEGQNQTDSSANLPKATTQTHSSGIGQSNVSHSFFSGDVPIAIEQRIVVVLNSNEKRSSVNTNSHSFVNITTNSAAGAA